MAYKNFFFRTIISIFLLSIYIYIINYELSYLKIIVFIIYLIILIEVFNNFKKKVIPIFYILISFLFFYNINFSELNIILFNFFIFIIISFDVFSFIFGKFLGKRKLLKNISPNKTIEGFIGGFAASLLLALLLFFIYKISLSLTYIFTVMLIIISAFTGDLIESYFKRINGLKNSSNFLPGHGGFFDRFDSFIFSIVPYSIFYKYINLI